ncbi:excitatory amino acid transporter 2-like isoform X2 [Littorina saxatilis]|uniref:excitatory amino acid transporter 2-like isoform X2 n=1 Tax=Littorina saxatilis TaxID=31220 RepID=UPI0038B5B546
MTEVDRKHDRNIEERCFLEKNSDGSAGAETELEAKDADDISQKARRTRCQRFFAWEGALLVLTIVGAAVGFVIGFSLYAAKVSSTALIWVGLPGELYMRMLKAAVLPLIVSSIITGAGGGAEDKNNKIVDTGNLQTSDLFVDLIRNLAPDNIVTACFQKTQTRYRESIISANETELVRFLGTSSGSNILGLVIVSAALGMASAQQGEIARPFLNFFGAAAEVIVCLLQWMVWLTPIGVISLIAKAIGSSTDLVAVFQGLGFLILAHVIGDVLIGVVFIALMYLIFQRKNPFVFLAGASRAIITAVAASSSAVAMPEVLNCVETRHKVDHRVSRFVVPLATALNREGSAMFIACTCIYVAQLQGSATAGNIVLIFILAAMGSLAVPAVPSSSIVTILMILDSMEIAPTNIGIIIALEWFSDRMRTMPNVISHILCAVLTWQFCKASLGFGDDDTLAAEEKMSQVSFHISSDEKGEEEINVNFSMNV